MSQPCEIASIHVREDAVEQFLSNIDRGAAVVASQPGCGSVRVLQCVEEPTEFLLFAEWDEIAAHNRFRESDDFLRYRETVQDTFLAPPSYKHYVPKPKG